MDKSLVDVISGGAGFIGSNLALELNKLGKKVIIMDNLCRGSKEHIKHLSDYEFFNIDLSRSDLTKDLFTKIEKDYVIENVWHMAANSDISAGVMDPNIDLRDTFMTTYNICNSIDKNPPEKFIFASSSAIYGDFKDKPIKEDSAPLLPISNYGAMKLASEGFLSTWVEKYNSKLYLFRFPNVVGMPSTHGVVFDFINRLKENPSYLLAMGDGTQQKPYLHVSDLIDAMFFIINHSSEKRQVFNIGQDDNGIKVKEIAEIVRNLFPNFFEINYGKSNKGWIGEVPKFNYKINKLKNLGWCPAISSKEAIKKLASDLYEKVIND